MIYTIHRIFVNDKTMQIRKSEAYRSNRPTFLVGSFIYFLFYDIGL